MPRGQTADAQVKVLLDKFARMRPGQSFFVPDAVRLDMEFLRRPALKLGCGIKIVQVEQDEIYLQQGVRVWREEGDYDEL